MFANNHSITSNLGDSSTISEVRTSLESFQYIDTSSSRHSPINMSEISNIIKTLKNGKAPGIDGVNNRCLKALPKKGIKYLTKIVNSCLKFGYFPQVFKEAKVVPIRKSNKPSDCPLSYRPISLLSSVSKIIEKIIKDKLAAYVDAHEIFPSEQFGFRREHNTIQPLMRIKNEIKRKFEQQKSTGMILMDIKAAFDSVWHDGLIYKMIKLNFPSHLIKIIQSFLQNRTFKVFISTHSSSVFQVAAGCPQGSCLSPLLYNIYTSDIPKLNNCLISIFADDTAILSSEVLASDIIRNLQSALSVLMIYFQKWKILINGEKSQAIYFTRKRKECFLPQTNTVINNMEIPWVQKVKYLGVALDTKMKFKNHIPFVIHKMNLLIKMLYPFINRKSCLSLDNKMLIFKSIFQSAMYYAAPLWASSANCHLKKLQIAQNKVLKIILNYPFYYSTKRLHEHAKVELVINQIETLTQHFSTRCSASSYSHINELVHS